MPLNLEDKKAIVAEVAEKAALAKLVIALEYRGLSVEKLSQFRMKARKEMYVRVIRNTLARRAVSDTDFACLQEHLTGPLMLVFAMNEPGDAARIVRDYVKENETCQVKLIAMNGKLLDAGQLSAVADLPTREQAISMLLSVMQAPISKFVRTASETYAQFVRVMGQVSDKKQAN